MGIRYCMHCGMPVPHRAKICPECGTSLKIPVPQNIEEPFGPRRTSEEPVRRTPRNQKTANKTAAAFAVGFIAVFCIAGFFVLNVAKKIENARSRYKEHTMETPELPNIRIPEHNSPEISMPEISIPDIQLPEPPAADFTVDSYAVETNLLGETVLYVNLNYTNLAENAQCFLTSYKIVVQQDGVSCRATAGDPTRDNHLLEYVQPNETVLISEVFIISADKEATVSVSPFFGEGNELEETVLPHSNGTVSVLA